MGRKAKYTVSHVGQDFLSEVVNVADIRRYWGKHPDTVRRAIDSGRLCYRQASDNRYLIAKASVIALWGQPHNAP